MEEEEPLLAGAAKTLLPQTLWFSIGIWYLPVILASFLLERADLVLGVAAGRRFLFWRHRFFCYTVGRAINEKRIAEEEWNFVMAKSRRRIQKANNIVGR